MPKRPLGIRHFGAALFIAPTHQVLHPTRSLFHGRPSRVRARSHVGSSQDHILQVNRHLVLHGMSQLGHDRVRPAEEPRLARLLRQLPYSAIVRAVIAQPSIESARRNPGSNFLPSGLA